MSKSLHIPPAAGFQPSPHPTPPPNLLPFFSPVGFGSDIHFAAHTPSSHTHTHTTKTSSFIENATFKSIYPCGPGSRLGP